METHGTSNSPRASEKRKPQIRTRKGVGVRRCWEERGANASWEQGRRFLPDAGQTLLPGPHRRPESRWHTVSLCSILPFSSLIFLLFSDS